MNNDSVEGLKYRICKINSDVWFKDFAISESEELDQEPLCRQNTAASGFASAFPFNRETGLQKIDFAPKA